jgi:DNA polymerase III alpha subunit/intein/homing endonuclease
MPEFVHLHCHTQYSLLDGAADIGTMMDKAVRDGQKGVALTDHGNMFGAFKFVAEAGKRNLKPIVGCEFYLVEDRHKKAFSRANGENDNRYHQLLLAKNKTGYENLSKLCSLGFIDGLYGKFPRIDKELIEKYHEGLVATSCCIGAEVPQAILHGKLEEAERKLRWWLDIFGEDYYIELQRHRGLENIDGLGVSQEDVNQKLLEFAKKYNVKVIATNDSHYVDEEDSQPHDILLCVNTNSLVAEKERFRFPSSDFYFKTQGQMAELFRDVPQALDTTMEIFDKIEDIKLIRDVLLPNFPLPPGFATQDDYLRHLTFEGAKKRYGIMTREIEDRLNFELEVIRNSGYPGYFLIVQDFTNTARKMGVAVGPGRGSAAGSAVAYCTGITNVDPIKYDLLFERFLNPERVSMPDIDIDFDDEGREKVINYVIEKYGRNQVAQIVTYGTMAAKLSLRDVGRVMNVPLSEVDRVSKSFPLHLKATLKGVLAKGDVDAKLKGDLNSEELDRAYKFRDLAAGEDDIGQMIRTAMKLEGSVRNTGIHACGVVITPDEITKYVPVKVDKESDMLVTQFDNSVAESAGLLKMDFLGLRTLSIIKDAIKMIRVNHGVEIDVDTIPLDDELTYKLFQRGDTVAIFQYESPGMQKYMKELTPTTFEDLIAMNALYRPGPLEYIPTFIARKLGREPITYDLPAMEGYLKDTYGVCLSGDTLVFDATTGARVRIDELGSAGDFYVQGVDENLLPQRARMTHWICNGTREVLEVKLRSGARLKLTPDHQVLTEKGWMEMGALHPGDYIATPRKLEVSEEQSGDRDQLRVLLAYLLADGSLSAKGGCRSDEKFIPDFVFGLNQQDIAFFLASLWDCDGHVGEKLCHIKTISTRLAHDVRTLLLRLGIYSTIYESQYFNNRRNQQMTAYQVTVYDLKAFAENIAPYLVNVRSRKKDGYLNDVETSLADLARPLRSLRETVSRQGRKGYAKDAKRLLVSSKRFGFSQFQLVPEPTLHNKSISNGDFSSEKSQNSVDRSLNVRWEEIVSIEPAGKELVYDITVEGIHNFVANNVIVHNCVYQEQVMLLSQKLANFSKGQADVLRKAMGKKQKSVLDAMYPKFVEGGATNGHPAKILEKVWKDWEAFASYAFNKSHSTCYALVAFHTAYLKAHYPAEFMASVLTHNKSNLSDITFFLQECKRMGIPVLGPDVNESISDFSANKKGELRFGLSALKGVGEGPVEDILREREKNGPFTSIYDFVRRLSSGAINKKVTEGLALGGAFDSFEDLHRAQYFAPSEKYDTYLEHLMRYGSAYQSQKAMASTSLFGSSDEGMVPEPTPPNCPPWSLIERLTREKEVTGIFISGHPLDDYRLEIDHFVTCTLDQMDQHQQKATLNLAGMVSSVRHAVSKNGNGWGIFELSDYAGKLELRLFGDDYQKFKHLFEPGKALFFKGAYQRGWRGDELEFKLKDARLLEGIGESLTESITLKIALDALTPEMVDHLDDLCKRYKGKHRLRMELTDKANRLRLNMISKERTVQATNEFIAEVARLGLEYRVN